jgi:ParB family chromosome partitioning protein
MPLQGRTPCPAICRAVMPRMGRALIPYTFAFTGDAPLSLKPGAQALALGRILPRSGAPTRNLRALHVLAVAESIATLGLLEPPLLDTQGRLLAGAHRVAAMSLLQTEDAQALRARFLACTEYTEPKKGDRPSDIGVLLARAEQIDPSAFHARYPGGKVPVHVVALDEANPAFHALSIETAENSIRRQYTPEEVQGLFDRLVAAGFTHKNGRPKGDEKTVVEALKGILGKSDSQVRRMLKGEAKRETSEWQAAVAALVRAAQRLERASALAKSGDAQEIMRAAGAILETASGRHIRRQQERRGKT